LIPLVFEHWNHDYNWYNPNNWPRDFILNGQYTLPYSYDELYAESVKVSNDVLIRSKKVLPLLYSKDIKTKYLYPIIVRRWNYFIRMQQHGFDFINPDIIQDCKNNLGKIVILYPGEGECGPTDWHILDSWCKKYGLRKEQVHFVHGNHLVPDNVYDFTYHPVNYFTMTWRQFNNYIEYDPTDDKNLFLCYNRVRRTHRTLLVCELIKNNLLDRGLVSYYNDGRSAIDDCESRQDLHYSAIQLDKNSPLILEFKDSTLFQGDNFINFLHHTRTFLSLVTETLTEEVLAQRGATTSKYSSIFFSEKTYKPIATFQPFMIVACKDHLKYLRDLGYKTFNDFWSEDYDTVNDFDQRIRLIISELQKLSKLSVYELIDLKKEMLPIILHNNTVYNEFRNTHGNDIDTVLYNIIEKIYQQF
jgi:hypothetical protein